LDTFTYRETFPLLGQGIPLHKKLVLRGKSGSSGFAVHQIPLHHPTQVEEVLGELTSNKASLQTSPTLLVNMFALTLLKAYAEAKDEGLPLLLYAPVASIACGW
jgi:hypothetical protein